jgi:D-alanyl-D-alanine carboxypeptidase
VPSPGTVDQLQPIDSSPPDLKDEMCGPHRKRMRQAEADDDEAAQASVGDYHQQFSVLLSTLRAPTVKNEKLLPDSGSVVPIVVYTGPTRPPGERPAPRAHSAEHTTAGHTTDEHTTAGHTTAEHKTTGHTTAAHTAALHPAASHTAASHTAASHTAASHTSASHTASGHGAAHAPPLRLHRPAVAPKNAD